MDAREENALLRACVAQWLRYERHCVIVSVERPPCVWYGVPDVLAMTARRTLIEVEVKRTLADFKANALKHCIKMRTRGHCEPPEQFYFAVPNALVMQVAPLLPENAGLLTFDESGKVSPYTKLPLIVVVRYAAVQKPSRVLTMREIVKMLKCQSGSLVSALGSVAKLLRERNNAPQKSGATVLPQIKARRQMLFVPDDFWSAHREWKANCGPSAFAALNCCSLATTRSFFPHFPGEPWTNPTQMREALLNARHTISQFKRWPKFGPVLVYWTFANQKHRVSRSHWIAVEQHGNRRMVYDCNAGCGNGAWITFSEWENEIVPRMLDTYRTGKLKPVGYALYCAYEIR
jgi:hypothetical protein